VTISAHEASHAVAASALGLTPTCVSIRPQPGTAGRMHHGPAAFAALDTNEPGIFGRLAVISLAGPLGEEWVRQGYRDWSPFAYDWSDAPARLDRDRVELLAGLAGGDIRDLVGMWRVNTIGWVSPYVRNGTIQRVAEKLERDKVLIAAELERMVGTRGTKWRRLDPAKETVTAGGRTVSLGTVASERDVKGRPVRLTTGRG